jgi:hypothetical protein
MSHFNNNLCLGHNDKNPQWKYDAQKVEKSIFTTTWVLYTFIGLSTIIYIIAPIVIFFVFFDHKTSRNWPLPIQV